MSPARYAWRGSLFAPVFRGLVGSSPWLRARGARVRSDPRARGRVVVLIVWRWLSRAELPCWFRYSTVPAIRWARRHGWRVVTVGGSSRLDGRARFDDRHGFSGFQPRCVRSAPSGAVRRAVGGDVDRFGCVSACLHPWFVFQCRCCQDAGCSLPAVRSLCRWQGFARAMVGTS